MEIDVTRMSSRGQVVIPQEIRESKGLKDGERFLVYDTEDAIILKRISDLKEKEDMEDFEKTFAKAWKIAKERKITKRDVEREIARYRKEKAG
jgi:AbrB family looped-hinge helix DNA binding protein